MQRIGTTILGQGIHRQLSKFYAWSQHGVDDGSEYRFGLADDFGWSEEPHLIDKTNKAALSHAIS
jgi:hypothetical protein